MLPHISLHARGKHRKHREDQHSVPDVYRLPVKKLFSILRNSRGVRKIETAREAVSLRLKVTGPRVSASTARFFSSTRLRSLFLLCRASPGAEPGPVLYNRIAGTARSVSRGWLRVLDTRRLNRDRSVVYFPSSFSLSVSFFYNGRKNSIIKILTFFLLNYAGIKTNGLDLENSLRKKVYQTSINFDVRIIFIWTWYNFIFLWEICTWFK